MTETIDTLKPNYQSLPKHWQLKKLGDVCEIRNGKNQKAVVNPNGKYPIYGSSGIMGFADEYLCEAGTTIIGRKGTINKPLYVDTQFWNVDTAFGISPFSNLLNSKFLFFFCQNFNFHKLDKSTTIPSLAKSDLLKIEIPIPPLPEQQAIVAKIEELLSELENGKQQLLTAQQQLNVYRKSLIMKGVTGKLTSKWRESNPNVDSSEKTYQLIQECLNKKYEEACKNAILNGKRKPKDQRKNKKTINAKEELPNLPSDWNYYRLEDITYLVTDGTHFTPKYQDTGVKFLSVKNVRPFYFREEAVKYISEEEHKSLIERCNPQKDDILYTKVGATFGYAARITMDYEFSIFVSLCLIKPVKEYFSSKFLEILMNSELVFKQARKRVSGSGVPDLHLIEIRDFKIPLPSIEEQNTIVTELESKLTVCDKIEETISQSLQQVETLRQSILKKAFDGKLVNIKSKQARK